ncbi:hypothetical protein ABT56_14360 [Photobacterium aquae]|uniref:Uncharacterized protein n=1 Tax=Photobacterium aquae TaxID=1195763 RepID=A0A0J1GYH7_9GAMM|nr:hypothetical protein ABT56_14360 [Photobacterium aquae]
MDEATKAGLKPYSDSFFRHTLLRKLGIELPPTHYCSFATNVLCNFITFTPIYALFMWFFAWQDMPEITQTMRLANAAQTGLLYGLLMAAYVKFIAKQKKLTPWAELTTKSRR